MQKFILFFKGMIIGIGKIIPGVSGSILAVCLGVYEQAVEKIANFKQNPIRNTFYLLPIAFGVAVSIIIFSKMILYFMTNHMLLTMSFFFGLLIGSIPKLVEEKICITKKDFALILPIIIVLFFLSYRVVLPEFEITSKASYLFVFILGSIDALSMIVPGLSGTAIFLMLGSYTYILKLFSNPLNDLVATFCFALGFLISFIVLTKLIFYSLQKYPRKTWLVIFTCIIYSLIEFFLKIPVPLTFFAILKSILFFILGLYLMSFIPEV